MNKRNKDFSASDLIEMQKDKVSKECFADINIKDLFFPVIKYKDIELSMSPEQRIKYRESCARLESSPMYKELAGYPEVFLDGQIAMHTCIDPYDSWAEMMAKKAKITKEEFIQKDEARRE